MAEERHSRRHQRLDGVVPTTVEALDRRRRAMCVLRAIDVLLQDGDSDNQTQSHKAKATSDPTQASAIDTTPGLGVYSPKTRVADKQTHCMVRFDTYSGRTPRTLPWRLKKRTPRTPGPGAYATAKADSITKPRGVSATFRTTNLYKSIRSEDTQQPDKFSSVSEPTPVSEPTTKSCKLVAYMAPAKPNFRTREQKLKIRALLAARQRWTRLGFYTVNHACVERRVGAMKIVPMARQSDASSKCLHPVQLRRRLMQWRQHEAVHSDPSSDQEPSKDSQKKPQAWKTDKEKALYKTSDQWRRAQARELLRVKALKARLFTANEIDSKPKGNRTKELSPSMGMSKQLGRDVVQCLRKKLKIVQGFSAQVQKERTKPHEPKSNGQATGPTRLSRTTSGGVPFSKATGRDDLLTDQHGVYLLGKDAELDGSAALDLNLDHVDALVRPRAPNALIRQRNDDDERFPLTAKAKKELEMRSILEPKFEIVEKSAHGHRFVRFEKQLDRPEFIFTTDNQLENDGEQLELPSEFPILEKIKFPGGNSVIVDYRTMQGREDVERLAQQLVDLVYEPNYDIRLTKAPTGVDMGKMLSRASDLGVVETSDERDQVLCKLRENHDEIAKAMRLLSKFKRQDVGFVDMRKGPARFETLEVDNQGGDEARATRLELSVLSSRARVDQTLVDMTKSLGRWREDRIIKTHQQKLVLNPKDEILSKRKRSVGLVDMKTQVSRRDFQDGAGFLDPTRDSATTRFLQRHMEL